MNGHVENKWARLPKAWEEPSPVQGKSLSEEAQVNDTDTGTLSNADIDRRPLSRKEELNREEDAASINPPPQVSDTQQTMPFPQFLYTLKNLLEVAPSILQQEEQEMEVEWAEARDECLRVTEEGLVTLQCDVAKSLVTILDSLDRGQRLRKRARDAERRSEKERWRKSRAETEKLMKRWAERWERGSVAEGQSREREKEGGEEEREAVGRMCQELRRQVQASMEKAESEREAQMTESDRTVAKQELALMEVLMEQLGAVEETCRKHCKITQDRMAHLWETMDNNRSARTENSGISEQFASSVTPLALLEPCLVRGRRPLLPPITSLNEEGGKRHAVHTGPGAPTQGVVWHLDPPAEHHREKKTRKKKAEMKREEEAEVTEKNEECVNIRKSWKQRVTEWLHAPLCGCAVRCY